MNWPTNCFYGTYELLKIIIKGLQNLVRKKRVTTKLWLPERYVKLLTNENIQTLVINKIKLVYNGKKELYNNQLKHDIMFV